MDRLMRIMGYVVHILWLCVLIMGLTAPIVLVAVQLPFEAAVVWLLGWIMVAIWFGAMLKCGEEQE